MSTDVTTHTGLSRRVAAEIRAEMARQQISGRTLAAKLGRSPNWVSLKTSGAQTLDLDDLATFAAALGVTVVDLFPRRDREVTVTYSVEPLAVIPSQRRSPRVASLGHGTGRPLDPAARTARVYKSAA